MEIDDFFLDIETDNLPDQPMCPVCGAIVDIRLPLQCDRCHAVIPDRDDGLFDDELLN